MKYRLYFLLACFAFAVYAILFSPVWVVCGKYPFGKTIDKTLDILSEKCFAGWNAYYDAVEKEFLHNPFVEDEHKEKYRCEGLYKQKKAMLDAYDKDMSINFDKIAQQL